MVPGESVRQLRRRHLRDDGLRVAHHGRRRVRVVAVDDDLHVDRPAIDHVSTVAVRNHQRRAHVVAVDQALDFTSRRHIGGEIEVSGIDERRDQRATLARPVAILDGEPDVTDVEVERIAVEQQEHRRHEQQDQQRPPVAADLPELLHRHGDGLPHAALSADTCSTTSRKTSSSEGDTRDADRIVCPLRLSAASTVATSSDARSQHGVDSRSEEARLFDLRQRVERGHRRHRIARLNLDDGPIGEAALERRGRAEGGELARVNDGNAMAVLGFVQIVGRHQHRDAALREVADQIPELPARQRIDAAGRLVEKHDRRLDGGWRSRARAAGASRRRARWSACARGLRGRPSSRTNARRSSKRLAAETVDAAEEADVLIDRQRLVEREALRHVADAALHAFGIARRRRRRRRWPCRRSARADRRACGWSWTCRRRSRRGSRRSRRLRRRTTVDRRR